VKFDDTITAAESVLDAHAVNFPDLCSRLTQDSPLPTVAVEGPNHTIRYANPAFCRLAGAEPEALLGRPFADAVPEGDGNRCVPLLDRVLHSGAADSLADQSHTHAGAQAVFWSYAVWAVLDESGRPAGVMLQVTDATEAVLYRRQVTEMNERLLLSGIREHELADAAQDANARLRVAMTETHHRVKNNLQVVAALAELQMEDGIAIVPATALQRIALHVRTLATLHDMLTERTSVDPTNDTISARTSLEKLLALLQPPSGPRRIRCSIAPLALPLVQSVSLSLLVSELVSNALKHGAGDIEVTLDQVGDVARLVVTDEGLGFPPDFDVVTAANTGLDLIVVMARHDLGGEAEFTNKPEGGGRVVIKFPHAGGSG
jgi:PAS domain S-box-containing protein